MDGERVLKFPKNFCWETNGQIAELIKQAEGCADQLQENSVGYYYYWMLQTLKEMQARTSLPSAQPSDVVEAMNRPPSYDLSVMRHELMNRAVKASSMTLEGNYEHGRLVAFTECIALLDKILSTTQQAQSGEWLPIESAPRDGTEVLLGSNKHDGVGVGLWTSNEWQGADNGLTWVKPTHWMPLPKPPFTQNKGD